MSISIRSEIRVSLCSSLSLSHAPSRSSSLGTRFYRIAVPNTSVNFVLPSLLGTRIHGTAVCEVSVNNALPLIFSPFFILDDFPFS
jgi:hypothetical protein